MALHVRRLEYEDRESFLALLAQLTDIGDDWDDEKWQRVFARATQCTALHTFVVESKRQLIGTASVLLEPKFIHGGSMVAHIEDVVVDAQARGTGVGRLLLAHCRRFAQNAGCYKIILDCKPELAEGFYANQGYVQSAVQMRCDLE